MILYNGKHLFVGKVKRGFEGMEEIDYFDFRVHGLRLFVTRSHKNFCKNGKSRPRLVVWLGEPTKYVGVKRHFCLRLTKPYIS